LKCLVSLWQQHQQGSQQKTIRGSSGVTAATTTMQFNRNKQSQSTTAAALDLPNNSAAIAVADRQQSN
jgi:hypothetical protein